MTSSINRGLATVNSEIFARVIFSRNFAYAEFREYKPFRNIKMTLSFTDICKIFLLTLFAKIKFLRNFRIYSNTSF